MEQCSTRTRRREQRWPLLAFLERADTGIIMFRRNVCSDGNAENTLIICLFLAIKCDDVNHDLTDTGMSVLSRKSNYLVSAEWVKVD